MQLLRFVDDSEVGDSEDDTDGDDDDSDAYFASSLSCAWPHNTSTSMIDDDVPVPVPVPVDVRACHNAFLRRHLRASVCRAASGFSFARHIVQLDCLLAHARHLQISFGGSVN